MSMAVNITTMSSHNLVIAMKPPIAMLILTVIPHATPTCFQDPTNIQKPHANSHGYHPNMNLHNNQPSHYSYNEITKSKNFHNAPAHYSMEPIQKLQNHPKERYTNMNSQGSQANQV
jgi:hypothetical protein